jgi:arylsulfatase A-like enzyme
MPARDSSDRDPPLLALALWAGIVTGLGELGKIAADLWFSDFTARSRDALWMIPAVDGVAFVAVGLVLALLRRRVRLPWWVAAGMFAGLGTLLVLLLVQRLHPLAGIAVAAGVGTQAGRWVQPRVQASVRAVRRGLPWLVGAVLLTAGASVGGRVVAERRLAASRPQPATGVPSVLLLILDTVRAAELSLYGYGRLTTPELEHWAERGTVFERAFAPSPWTLPSHASIFTGRPELTLGATHWDRLGTDWPTLAEVMRARGYGTAAFVANTDWAGWDSGLSRGFERYDDYPVSLWTAVSATSFGRVIYPMLYDRLPGRLQRLPGGLRLRHPQQHRSAAAIAAGFLAWLDDRPRAPYFAFLNFMDAHTPYTPPDSFRNRYRTPMPRPVSPYAWSDRPPVRLTPTDLRPKQDLYDGSIAYLDAEIGRLLGALERRGALEHTLVVLTADHGEEFAEHGLGGHGSTLYRLSVQVPLVLWFPGRVPAGRRVATPVSLQNLGATVLDLAAPGPGRLPGRSLARFWRSPDQAQPDTILATVRLLEGRLGSIAFGGRRYIRDEITGSEELYDFEHDVLERWSLSASDSARRVLPAYRDALRRFGAAEQAPTHRNWTLHRRPPGYRLAFDSPALASAPADRCVVAPVGWAGWRRMPEVEVVR